MSGLEPQRRRQIERALDRPLFPDDLVAVESIAALTAQQVDVVRTLAQRQLVAALDYMRAVVPTASTDALKAFINQYA